MRQSKWSGGAFIGAIDSVGWEGVGAFCGGVGDETRQGLSHFLRDQIIEESDRVLGGFDEVRSKSEVQEEMTYRLRKFQELRKCVENPAFSYFQRV